MTLGHLSETSSLPARGQFCLADAESLKASMPALVFDPGQDSAWPKTAQVQQYLNFYRLNFSGDDPSLAHGFGYLNGAGFKLACHYWIPAQARGTLVVVHGYYDHVGVFDKAIAFGLAHQLAVLAFDLPGHGLSSGERAAIDSFDQYADALAQVLQSAQALLPAPFYALGQSTGGSVLLNYLWRYEQLREQAHQAPVFSRMALNAPLILPRAWASGRILYALLHKFIGHLPRGKSRSSHDPAFNQFVDTQDCLQSRQLSVRWVGAMKAWDRQFRGFAPIANQLLIVQGTEDLTVAWRYNLKQLKRALPNARQQLIPGAGHQLVNETSQLRRQVFGHIEDYFFAGH